MADLDIRWKQRFINFQKAIRKIQEVVDGLDFSETDEKLINQLSELEKEGLIQRFEYTHELAWKVMKDFANYQGNSSITGSKDATREAFKMGIITEGETWMKMIISRNLTSHIYDENHAEEIFLNIVQRYYPLLKMFEQKMISKLNANQLELE